MTSQEQHQLGIGLYRQGRYEEAAQLFSKMLESGENSEIWNDWASARAAAGHLQEAKSGYERALQLDPENREAVGNLAVLVRYDIPKQSAFSGAPAHAAGGTAHITERIKQNWEFADRRQLLYALIGYEFGMEPEKRLDDIRAYKQKESAFLIKSLGLTSQDIVFDLGSGCGFIARVVAPLCKRLYCLDISRDFLRFAQEELLSFSNVGFHQIEYGDLCCLDDMQVSKGYANAVFIHFNLFDIVTYLREVFRILARGGVFVFGMCNSDSLDIAEDRYFRIVLQHYLRERNSPTLMQWNSAHSVCSIARQIGFEADELWSRQGTAMLRLQKR
jgi:pentatricopeptide repeat protein